MDACENSGNEVSEHFGEATEMISIGKNAKRSFSSYVLSRYACYLIVMNGDPRKVYYVLKALEFDEFKNQAKPVVIIGKVVELRGKL